jgi:hypothetical protein
MTQDLFFAFQGEGKADYAFLIPVIERMLRDLLPQYGVQGISIDGEGDNPTDEIIRFVKKYRGYQLLFFHRDADSPTTHDTHQRHFEPAFKQLRDEGVDDAFFVPVIPVRNTEAWVCADFEAFQQVIGTDKSASDLGFPSVPHQVETIPDTKALLKEAINRAKSRRRRPTLDTIYPAMAERVRLTVLNQIPAYKSFRQQTITTLQQAGHTLS